MLKIKDNVDLKKLKKFGYKQGQDTCNISYSAYGKIFEINDTLIDIVEIDKNTKKIELLRSSKNSFRSFIDCNEKQLKKYIDNLIKADLVEKVED